MKMVSVTLAGSPKEGEQIPRAYAELRGDCVGVQCSILQPGTNDVIEFRPGDEPESIKQRQDAARRLAEYLDGKDGDPKACLQVVETLLAMGGPGPEPEPEPASDDGADLAEAITDSICPEAAAILATRLQTIIRTDDETINSQCSWFADMLAGLVGGWESAQETAKQYGIE